MANNNDLKPRIKRTEIPFRYQQKNNIEAIWDELELLLSEDEDFKIKSIEGNTCTIKVLRKEAFFNPFIMSKIIGRIIPSNCKIELNINHITTEKFDTDVKVFEFSIFSNKNNFYEGKINIVF
jgi:hypothetical protein